MDKKERELALARLALRYGSQMRADETIKMPDGRVLKIEHPGMTVKETADTFKKIKDGQETKP